MGLGLVVLLSSFAKQGDQTVVDADIDAVIQRMAKDPREVDTLRSIGWKNMPRVIWNYKHANGSVRSRILDAIHSDSGSFSELLPLAAKEKAVDLRIMAATILARISVGPSVARRNPVLFSMRKDPSPDVRAIVAKGMRWGYPDYKHTLNVMMKDKSPYVRLQAALSLAYHEQKECVPVLAEFVGTSHLYTVPVMIGGEDSADSALIRFGVMTVPFVEPKLSSKSSQVLINALNVLKVVKAPKIMTYAKKFLQSKDPLVRIAGYQAIGWERKPEAIPILLKGLEDHASKNNTFVDSNVKAVLEGQLGPWPEKEWPEGVAALKKWKEDHPDKMI